MVIHPVRPAGTPTIGLTGRCGTPPGERQGALDGVHVGVGRPGSAPGLRVRDEAERVCVGRARTGPGDDADSRPGVDSPPTVPRVCAAQGSGVVGAAS